ncbi:MAG: sortase [Anaerolineales bacterium]|nr:sortase [Anaerolineales bacterium]
MNLEQISPTPENAPTRRGPRLLLAALALALSLALLGAWFGALAAPEAEPKTAPVNKPLAAPGFDLAIKKSQIPTIFTVGTNNRYVINVTRTNTETVSESPRVEDQLPDGMTVTTINATDTAGAWDCSTSTATLVSCVWSQSIPASLTTFPAIIVGVRIDSDIPDIIVTNTAVLLTKDADPSNNVDKVDTVIDSVDLQIAKAVSNSYPDVGETIDYTLWVTNTGPSDAVNVTVDEDLSIYMDYYPVIPVPGNPTQGSYDHTTGIWTVGFLPKDHSAKITFRASPKDTALGRKITNTAVITSTNTSDWKPSNNTASADVIVTGLEITKNFEPSTSTCEMFDPEPCYYVGEPIAFTIVVYNNSDLAASSVVVSDAFTPTLDVVDYSYEIRTNLGAVTSFGPYSSSRNFSRSFGTLNPHYTLTIHINTRPNSTFDEIKEIFNVAKVTSYPSVVRYSDEVKLYIKPAIDLVLTKTDSRTTVYAGGTYTYTVSIQNIGPYKTITNIIFIDTFSANVSDVVLSQGTLSMTQVTTTTAQTIVWKIGTRLEPDESISFKVRGKVSTSAANGDEVENTATIRLVKPKDTSTGQFESYTGNNTVTDLDTVVVEPEVDVELYLRLNPNKAIMGDIIIFRIDVRNGGTTTLTNVKITDTFPSVQDIIEVITTRGSATTNSSTRTVTTSLGSMAPNAEASIQIKTKVNSTVTASTTYAHRATMTWDTNQSLNSNEVKYRIIATSTLPGTGFDAGNSTPVNWQTALPVILLAALGLLGAAFGAWRKLRSHRATWLVLLGLALVLVSASLACSTMGPGAPPGQETPPDELSALQRTGPAKVSPTATLAGLPVQPSATPGPGEEIAIATVVEVIEEWVAPTYTPTPTALPDFPIPTPALLPTVGPMGFPTDASAVTRLVIPTLGVDNVVKYVPREKGTWLIGGLKYEIAWMGDTSWPGLGGNTGLAGHVDLADGSDGPFRRLDQLKTGDEVTVYTEKSQYIYQVSGSVVVEESDLSVIAPSESPKITLITCTGWDPEFRLYTKRLIVYAMLVGVRPL